MLDRAGYSLIAEKTFSDFRSAPPAKEDAWRYCVRVTSGTTGGQLIGAVLQYQAESVKRFSQLRAPVLCLGASATRLAYNLQARHGMPAESRSLVLDGADLNSELKVVLAQYAPDSILGFVSFVVRVAEYIDRETALGVRAIILSGECTTEAMESLLRDTFPNARITSRYIALEVGRISEVSCGFQPPNHYHPYKGVKVEIDSPDESGVGSILVSPSTRPEVIQYQLGDVGRLKSEPCPCGATEILEIMGRNGRDYVKLAGAIVRREECDRVMLSVALFDDYRLDTSHVILDGKLRGKLHLRVYRKDGQRSPDLGARIEKEFSRQLYLSPSRTLAELVRTGDFVPLSVTFADAPFPIKNKEIKILMVDA